MKGLSVIRTFCAVLALLMFSSTAMAVPNWYYGKVERVFIYTSGFILEFDTTSLDDCLHTYVYFRTPALTDANVDRALSVALAAQATNKTVGVVIDKAINGPGGQCNAIGSIDIKD